MSRIRILAATMTHDGHYEAETHYTPAKLARAISSLMIAGFQENAVDVDDLHIVGNELGEVGQALGDKLTLADKYDRIPAETAGHIRKVLGLLYISQLAQGQAFGLMSADPVVALAMAQTWNQLHIDMPGDDELSAEEQARFHALTGPNDEGDYPETVAGDEIRNFNATGCVCGKDHGTGGSKEERFADLSVEDLLDAIPDELKPILGMLAMQTGKTELEITQVLRESFLRGERPGTAMERLLRESMEANHAPSPKAEAVKAGDDVVEQLYQQALASLPPLRDDQRTALRAQLESQRAEIETTARAGGVQALNIKLPK